MSDNIVTLTSPRLADLLECEPTTTTIVGVEREYRVLDPGMAPIDFRTMISTLSLPGGGLNPADPNAHHLPSGVLLTADGLEAEVSTPPVDLAEHFTWQAASWAELGEDALVEAIPRGTAIEGYSTHLNISVGTDVVPVADLFAKHFASGMMLLLDQADSPGLLVRPRPGRLELGGDFVEGEQLRAALTYAAAAARRCVTALRTNSDRELPPAIVRRLERAKERPGWFVAPSAADREELALAWHSARDELTTLAAADELTVMDEIVDGRRPIPREHLSGPDRPGAPRTSPFADLRDRHRGDIRVSVKALSWAAVAFQVQSATREFHVVVPRRWLRSFLDRLDAGALDAALAQVTPTRADESGPRVVLDNFEPRDIVPPEPQLTRSWLHRRRPEIIAALAGSAAVAAASRVWPW